MGETVETEETEAPYINKLRKGGAVIIGIANMHQLGMGTSGCNGSRYELVELYIYMENRNMTLNTSLF